MKVKLSNSASKKKVPTQHLILVCLPQAEETQAIVRLSQPRLPLFEMCD